MNITLHQKVIFAVRSNNIELVKERIAEGGDINYQDPKYGSALVTAINNGNEHTLKWLIENGVDVTATNEHGIGALEVALRHPKPAIVKLLAWSGAKLNKKAREYYGQRLEDCLKIG